MTTVQEPQIHQIPTLREASGRRGRITDEEILTEHGELLWSALIAFASQPDYFAEMVEAANNVELRRAASAATKPEPKPKPPPKTRECDRCGAVFQPRHGRQSFCSAQCRRAKEREARPEERTVPCEVCGVEFTTRHPLKRYCTDRCARAANRARRAG